jgi:hypothetical protein
MGRLRVKVAAVALELRGKKDDVGVVDLLGGTASSWSRASDRSMRRRDLV